MNETEFHVHHWGFICLEFHWTKRLSTWNRVFQSSSIFETKFFFPTSFRVDRSGRSVKSIPIVVERHLSRVGCASVDENMQKRTKHFVASARTADNEATRSGLPSPVMIYYQRVSDGLQVVREEWSQSMKKEERWTRNFRITGECIDCLRPFLLS